MPLRVQILILSVLLRSPMMINHVSKMAVGNIVVLVAIGKSVLRKLQDDRNQDEQLLNGVFCDVTLEFLYDGTVLVDDGWLGSFELRDWE
jgi:hypothetical protein